MTLQAQLARDQEQLARSGKLDLTTSLWLQLRTGSYKSPAETATVARSRPAPSTKHGIDNENEHVDTARESRPHKSSTEGHQHRDKKDKKHKSSKKDGERRHHHHHHHHDPTDANMNGNHNGTEAPGTATATTAAPPPTARALNNMPFDEVPVRPAAADPQHPNFSSMGSTASNNIPGDATPPPPPPLVDYSVPQSNRELGPEVVAVRTVTCPKCERPFAEDRLEKHRSICERVKDVRSRGGVFDATQKRQTVDMTESMPDAAMSARRPQPAQSKWREKHEQFQRTIKGISAPELDDRVQCPHCNRKFNEETARRHIDKCIYKSKRI
eukprot:PhM_4_TR2247/c0_g1_i1/m.2326